MNCHYTIDRALGQSNWPWNYCLHFHQSLCIIFHQHLCSRPPLPAHPQVQAMVTRCGTISHHWLTWRCPGFTTCSILRDHSWPCSDVPLWCQRPNSGQLHARKMCYILYYCSDQVMNLFVLPLERQQGSGKNNPRGSQQLLEEEWWTKAQYPPIKIEKDQIKWTCPSWKETFIPQHHRGQQSPFSPRSSNPTLPWRKHISL